MLDDGMLVMDRDRETIGHTLRRWRKEAGLSTLEVGEYLEMSKYSVEAWEKGTGKVSIGVLIKLRNLYPKHTEELLRMAGLGDIVGDALASRVSTRPVSGYVSCGIPVETYDVELGLRLPVPSDLDTDYPESRYLRVRGDSLRDAGIEDGDFLLVVPFKSFTPGKLYVVRIEGDVCVRWVVVEHGQIILKSSNGDYPDISGKPVEPVGQVVYHMKGRRV